MPLVNPSYPSDGQEIDAADYTTILQAVLAVLNGNIDTDNLAAGAVGTTDIADNAVTAAKVVLAAQMAITAAGSIQGAMINGKIATSVSSNNLTVAIKTLAGNNPSASDPVYVRVGNTVRAITASLSVVLNAGTNWFGSGGSMFAAQEVDYFVYLGYNSSDGVTLGFSRIPYGRVYSDFSATSTNETYAAISTITHASSTDEYENVGRFNATLSATSSFNWSIPGTSIIINKPTFRTRELTYVPTTATLALGTGGTCVAKYTIENKYIDLTILTTLGTGGTHASGSTYTTPLTVGSNDATAVAKNMVALGNFHDNSASVEYILFGRFDTTTTIRIVYLNGTTGASSGTPPQVPAISDTFFLRMRYILP